MADSAGSRKTAGANCCYPTRWVLALLKCESTPGHAILRTANGEIRESNNPDNLLEEVTGQRLPVSRFPDWLLGRSNEPAKIQRDFLGRPQQLLDDGWQVDYTYDSEAADALPSVLKLKRNSEIELRLRIEEWKDAP